MKPAFLTKFRSSRCTDVKFEQDRDHLKSGRLHALSMFLFAVLFLTGCPNSTRQAVPTQPENSASTSNDQVNSSPKNTKMKTDISALKRFIEIPGEVSQATWQTGQLSNQPGAEDWWLAAILNFAASDQDKFVVGASERKRVDFPSDFEFEGEFEMVKSLNEFESSNQQHSCVADVFPTTPFESSPLLHGHTVRLNDKQILVYLWTQ